MISICIFFVLSYFNGITATPEYGSYTYDGHGHSGYNAVGPSHKVRDYYSKPQYAFGYEVEDYYTQLSHGRWEVRDGDVTQGQYRVLLPDGRLQVVSYIADKGGYRPIIQYFGKGVHPPPPPAYVKIKPPKGIPDPYLHPAATPLTTALLGPAHTPPAPSYLANPVKIDGPGPTGFVPVQGFRRAPYPSPSFGNHHQGDELYYGSSSKSEVKLSPEVYRGRALLYDRTLFRRDIPQPPVKPR